MVVNIMMSVHSITNSYDEKRTNQQLTQTPHYPLPPAVKSAGVTIGAQHNEGTLSAPTSSPSLPARQQNKYI